MENEMFSEAVELWKHNDTQYEAAVMMRQIKSPQSLRVAGDWFMMLQELEEAIKCWKIADQEYSDLAAILKLMECSIDNSNDEEFEIYATKASKQNHPEATIKLANFFQRQVAEIPNQDDPAFIWSRKAASYGDSISMRYLAEWSRDIRNQDSESDGEGNATMSWYKKAAKRGDVQSICIIAFALFHGIDCDRDIPAALEYFVKASRIAARPSLHTLGKYYKEGEHGVFEPDPARAFDLFSEASKQGDTDAMKSMADALYCGIGCERDIDAAVEIYEAAIKNGSAAAIACLAKHYYTIDAEKSRELLLEFIRKMSDGRDIDGICVDEILENWIAEDY